MIWRLWSVAPARVTSSTRPPASATPSVLAAVPSSSSGPPGAEPSVTVVRPRASKLAWTPTVRESSPRSLSRSSSSGFSADCCAPVMRPFSSASCRRVCEASAAVCPASPATSSRSPASPLATVVKELASVWPAASTTCRSALSRGVAPSPLSASKKPVSASGTLPAPARNRLSSAPAVVSSVSAEAAAPSAVRSRCATSPSKARRTSSTRTPCPEVAALVGLICPPGTCARTASRRT